MSWKIILPLVLCFVGLVYYWNLEEDVSDHPSASVLIGRRYELKKPMFLETVASCPRRCYLCEEEVRYWPTSTADFYSNRDAWDNYNVIGVLDAGEQIRITKVVAQSWTMLGDVRVVCAVVETGRHKGVELDLTGHTEGICWDETLYVRLDYLASLDGGEDAIVNRAPIPHSSKSRNVEFDKLFLKLVGGDTQNSDESTEK